MGRRPAPILTEEEYQNQPPPPPNRLVGVPADEWIAQELAREEEPWLLHNAILPGGLTIVSGRPKAGKSFVAYLMAMALSSGKSLGPFKPTGRYTSLYVDLEGVARQTAKRLHLLSLGHSLDYAQLRNIRVVHGEPVELLQGEMAAALVAAVRETGAKVLFLDTFARSFTGDENAKRDVQKYLDVLYEVRTATGVAVVLVHHTNKAQFQYKDTAVFMDPDGGLRGSSAIAGAYDVIFSLQDGWVEGEHLDVMMSKGKYTAEWWCDYSLDGERQMGDDGEEEFTRSWLDFGRRRNELGLFERAPSGEQPGFRKRGSSDE